MTDKLFHLLGLCMRAGGMISGEQMSEQTIKRGRAYAALIDEGASDLAKKQMRSACENHGVPLLEIPADALGRAIGKPGRMAAAVTDQGFSNRMIQLYTDMKKPGVH